MKAFAAADLCGLYIPEDFGGMGQNVFNFCLATEEISRICGGVGVTFAASALGSHPDPSFWHSGTKKKIYACHRRREKAGGLWFDRSQCRV